MSALRFARHWMFLPFLLCTLFTVQVRGEDALYTGDKSESIPNSEPGQKLSFGFETDVVSRYVWRGIALSNGPVLQPSMWFSLHGATLMVWGNFVLNNEPNQGQLNEVDFNLTYNYEYKRLILQPLLLFYVFPHQDTPSTGEAALAVGVRLGAFRLFTAQFFDFVASPGAYFGLAGVSFEKELHPKFSLKSTAGFGWANSKFNDVNLEVSRSAANLFMWSLDLNWCPRHPLFFRPHVKVTTLLNEDLRHAVENPTIISGGLAMGVEF